MSAQLTFEAFWQRFLATEKLTRAFDLKISGIQLYPFLRTRLFYAIAQQVGLFDDPHPSFSKETEEFEPLATLDALPAKASSVVVPFRRQVAGAEPYSDRIVGLLRAAGEQPFVLPYSFESSHADNNLDRLRSNFALRFDEQAREKLAKTGRYLRWQRPEISKRKYAKLIAAFEAEFGVEMPTFAKYPSWLLRRALTDQWGFAEVFKRLGTRRLFIVNAYSDAGLVRAAKLAGVKVSEIQHGFVSAYHPAYQYPRGVSSQSAPDVLLTWGDYWNTAANFPRGMKARTSGPTEAFAEYRTKAIAENRIVANRVLFTSQGAIGPELFKAALAVAKRQPQLDVIFRLHPNEVLADFEARAEKLTSGKGLPENLKLSHKQPVFLDLVSTSEFLIGGFSTTLFEGLALGCKVLVLPVAGFENVRPAIASGDITLVTDLDDLPHHLATSKRVINPERYYATQTISGQSLLDR